MKFAAKKVTGWKDRHLNNTSVMKALATRQRNGFTLDIDERQFWDDTISLFKLYNDPSKFSDWMGRIHNQ